MNNYKFYVVTENYEDETVRWYAGEIIEAKPLTNTDVDSLWVKGKHSLKIPGNIVRPLELGDAQLETAWHGMRKVAEKMGEMGFPIVAEDETIIGKHIMSALTEIEERENKEGIE